MDIKPNFSEAHPEAMDFLWLVGCDSANRDSQPEQQHRSLILHDNPIKGFKNDTKSSSSKINRSVRMDESDGSIPPWKSSDVKSWIWMQQAMHPELNYNSCFRKKWLPWKIIPFRGVSIKKWLKVIKQKWNEDKRLQRAEVLHGAISVAGIAAALAAIAAENSGIEESSTTKESAVASAATLVAAHCAQVAEAMGAKKQQLSTVIGLAMTGTSAASDI